MKRQLLSIEEEPPTKKQKLIIYDLYTDGSCVPNKSKTVSDDIESRKTIPSMKYNTGYATVVRENIFTGEIEDGLVFEEEKGLNCQTFDNIKKSPVTRKLISCIFKDKSSSSSPVIQQNNGAELIALVYALRYAVKHPEVRFIYTDSSLLFRYWRRSIKKEKLQSFDKTKQAFILELQQLNRLWTGMKWIAGNKNLADLGYH